MTAIGDPTPRFILAVSGVEKVIARERERYVQGQITADQFEERLDGALHGD